MYNELEIYNLIYYMFTRGTPTVVGLGRKIFKDPKWHNSMLCLPKTYKLRQKRIDRVPNDI